MQLSCQTVLVDRQLFIALHQSSIRQPDIHLESRFFAYRTGIQRPNGGSQWVYCHNVWYGKTRMVWLPDSEKMWIYYMFIRFDKTYERDGRTHGEAPHDGIDHHAYA